MVKRFFVFFLEFPKTHHEMYATIKRFVIILGKKEFLWFLKNVGLGQLYEKFSKEKWVSNVCLLSI